MLRYFFHYCCESFCNFSLLDNSAAALPHRETAQLDRRPPTILAQPCNISCVHQRRITTSRPFHASPRRCHALLQTAQPRHADSQQGHSLAAREPGISVRRLQVAPAHERAPAGEQQPRSANERASRLRRLTFLWIGKR